MKESEWWSDEDEENIVVGHGNAKQNEDSNPKIALLEVNHCEGEIGKNI
jgi:hypothetical protein